jgi:anti-sigma B factor antagonist
MEVKSINDVKVVTVLQRIDAYNAKELEDGLNEIVSGGAKKMVCNFEKNEYISSAGLRVFLALLKSMKKSGGDIALCSLQPSVKNIFDIAGFSRLFNIFDTLDEALNNLK